MPSVVEAKRSPLCFAAAHDCLLHTVTGVGEPDCQGACEPCGWQQGRLLRDNVLNTRTGVWIHFLCFMLWLGLG